MCPAQNDAPPLQVSRWKLLSSTVNLALKALPCTSGTVNLALTQMESLNAVLPEGLPMGMVKEFQDSIQIALLARQSF
ncbi:putative 28S ribosomal protein S29, mitochondrial-like [Sesbania bispinosa]|nr:putative 28S ribosomal protein S29, mitochondrial-like [Sesbania bispinosa]